MQYDVDDYLDNHFSAAYSVDPDEVSSNYDSIKNGNYRVLARASTNNALPRRSGYSNKQTRQTRVPFPERMRSISGSRRSRIDDNLPESDRMLSEYKTSSKFKTSTSNIHIVDYSEYEKISSSSQVKSADIMLKFSKWISIRENYISRIIIIVNTITKLKKDDKFAFLKIIVSLRKVSLDIVGGYHQLSFLPDTDQSSIALNDLKKYILKMATDLNFLSLTNFKKVIGLDPTLNTFFSTHRIDGTLALLKNESQDPNQNQNLIVSLSQSYLPIPEAIVMSGDELESCNYLAPVIYNIYCNADDYSGPVRNISSGSSDLKQLQHSDGQSIGIPPSAQSNDYLLAATTKNSIGRYHSADMSQSSVENFEQQHQPRSGSQSENVYLSPPLSPYKIRANGNLYTSTHATSNLPDIDTKGMTVNSVLELCHVTSSSLQQMDADSRRRDEERAEREDLLERYWDRWRRYLDLLQRSIRVHIMLEFLSLRTVRSSGGEGLSDKVNMTYDGLFL